MSAKNLLLDVVKTQAVNLRHNFLVNALVAAGTDARHVFEDGHGWQAVSDVVDDRAVKQPVAARRSATLSLASGRTRLAREAGDI